MQSDFGNRCAIASAADAGRYPFGKEKLLQSPINRKLVIAAGHLRQKPSAT
jgi:hypothetical protein